MRSIERKILDKLLTLPPEVLWKKHGMTQDEVLDRLNKLVHDELEEKKKMTISVPKTEIKTLFYGLASRGYNRFFRCRPIMKDGTTRWITCRLDVTSYLKGGQLSYDPFEKGYLIVADMDLIRRQKRGDVIKSVYRTVNLNTLQEFKMGGRHYMVVEK